MGSGVPLGCKVKRRCCGSGGSFSDLGVYGGGGASQGSSRIGGGIGCPPGPTTRPPEFTACWCRGGPNGVLAPTRCLRAPELRGSPWEYGTSTTSSKFEISPSAGENVDVLGPLETAGKGSRSKGEAFAGDPSMVVRCAGLLVGAEGRAVSPVTDPWLLGGCLLGRAGWSILCWFCTCCRFRLVLCDTVRFLAICTSVSRSLSSSVNTSTLPSWPSPISMVMIDFPQDLEHLPKSKIITLPPSTIRSSPSPPSKIPTPPLATATNLSPYGHFTNFNPANPSTSPICRPLTNIFLDRSLRTCQTPCCALLLELPPDSPSIISVLLPCPSDATVVSCSRSNFLGTPYTHTLFPPNPTATISPSGLGDGSTVGPTLFSSLGPAK